MTIAVTEESLTPESLSQTQSSALFLAITLASLQILDGTFTSIGVSLYGIGMEANPILRTLMNVYGVNLTLGLVKSLAILIVFVLYKLSSTVPWVTHAFKGLILLYLSLAIIPWSLIMAREVISVIS